MQQDGSLEDLLRLLLIARKNLLCHKITFNDPVANDSLVTVMVMQDYETFIFICTLQ